MFANSPLPDSHGSLSKNIHIEKHFNLLRQITVDMPESKVRELPGADDGIVTTALKRYLLVERGIVRRDKLISLIYEEGSLTERVCMAMYLLFMLRDARCRSFICKNLAQADGRWSDAALQLKNASYPEFEHVGTTKAYTNLRGFLFQAGLVDRTFHLTRFPDLSRWLSDAVEISSQHIKDFELKQQFLEAPQAVLAKYGSLGLLNLDTSEMLTFQPGRPSDEGVDLLPIYEEMPEDHPFDSSTLRSWERTGPIKRSSLSPKLSLANPALLERANSQHFLLEKLVAALCLEEKFSVHETVLIDLLAKHDSRSIIFEMKSCTRSSLRSQVRRGVSQLLEYSFLYREEVKAPHLCLVLERKPQGSVKWMIDYVESLDISMLWKHDQDDELACSKRTQARLGGILQVVTRWDC